jgi:hypothetical protein
MASSYLWIVASEQFECFRTLLRLLSNSFSAGDSFEKRLLNGSGSVAAIREGEVLDEAQQLGGSRGNALKIGGIISFTL